MNIRKNKNKVMSRLVIAFSGLLMLSLAACEDGKSYSDMLREEEIAVNWYLAQNRVENAFPDDGSFKYGDDAPYYRMDNEGSVYMKVIDPGNMENRPEDGDLVYFRFMRMNIKSYYDTRIESWAGNANDMNSSLNGTSLVFGNKTLSSTTQYGDGLQVPLKHLGYDCQVSLIVKSIEGWSGDISNCIPYVYDIRYFKGEY